MTNLDVEWAKDWMRRSSDTLTEHRMELIDLDRAFGDGDPGENMARGFTAVIQRMDEAPPEDVAGVFKLVALQQDGAWKPAIKRSDTPEKVLNPGAKRLWRLTDRRGMATADVLSTADERLRPGDELVLHHHAQPHVSRRVNADDCADAEELSVRVIAGGEVACDGGQEALDDLEAIAARRSSDVAALGPGVRRLVNPHTYHVSITERVWRLKRDLLTSLT